MDSSLVTAKATAIIAMCLVAGVVAAPAPWYKWRSKVNGRVFCLQNSPGEGWDRTAGPFKDSRCERPGTPGD